MKNPRLIVPLVLLVAPVLMWIHLATNVLAQAKREKEVDTKTETSTKGLTLKEARRLALENSYELHHAKKMLVDKRISRAQYEQRQAKVLADLERTYMGLYLARLELQVAQQRAARGTVLKIPSRGTTTLKDARPLLNPELAEQERAIAKARELAIFIPLEQQLKMQELNLKILLNSKSYPLRSDDEIVPTDRPTVIKKELNEDALIEKAIDYASRLNVAASVVSGRKVPQDRSAFDLEQEKKRITAAVKRAVLKATASGKRLEIARQVKALQENRLNLLRAAKAPADEIAEAEIAIEEASMEELRAIVAHNNDLLDIAELTGTVFKDLNYTPED